MLYPTELRARLIHKECYTHGAQKKMRQIKSTKAGLTLAVIWSYNEVPYYINLIQMTYLT